MKKQMMSAATALMALIVAATILTAGCAPAKNDSSTSGNGTSFFPNVNL